MVLVIRYTVIRYRWKVKIIYGNFWMEGTLSSSFLKWLPTSTEKDSLNVTGLSECPLISVFDTENKQWFPQKRAQHWRCTLIYISEGEDKAVRSIKLLERELKMGDTSLTGQLSIITFDLFSDISTKCKSRMMGLRLFYMKKFGCQTLQQLCLLLRHEGSQPGAANRI